MTDPRSGRGVFPPEAAAPGLHVESWRGPEGQYVVVPIGEDGRIVVPAPIYVRADDPAGLEKVREQFYAGTLPGQRR